MYSFDNIGVFFGAREVIAQSVNINSKNSVVQNTPLGTKNSKGIPSGPVTHSLSINYYPKLLSDPLITTIISENSRFRGYSSFPEVMPTIVKIGPLSGSFFFTDYKLSIESQTPVIASVSMISFGALSGLSSASEINKLTSISGDVADIGHSWTTSIIDSDSNVSPIPVYNIEYLFNRELSPVYALGNKEPVQILRSKTTKKASFKFDNIYYIDFSGQLVEDVVQNYEFIKIQGYSSLYDIPDGEFPSGSGESGYSGISGITEIFLSIEQMEITQISNDININSMLATTVECEKSI